jgi:hypothetical protein
VAGRAAVPDATIVEIAEVLSALLWTIKEGEPLVLY